MATRSSAETDLDTVPFDLVNQRKDDTRDFRATIRAAGMKRVERIEWSAQNVDRDDDRSALRLLPKGVDPFIFHRGMASGPPSTGRRMTTGT